MQRLFEHVHLKAKKMSFDNFNSALTGKVQVLQQPSIIGLEWTHKCSKRNSVINIRDFPARNASGRASIALRRSAKAVPACRRWSPPAPCTCTCSAAVDAILHSFKNAQVVILDNDRSLSRITTCKCALLLFYKIRMRLSPQSLQNSVAKPIVTLRLSIS